MLIALNLACVFSVTGQVVQSASSGPVIDTVIVLTRNVFGAEEAQRNVFFRIANGLRFTTRAGIVRRELLFRPGDPYDSALVAESGRNLRALGVFRQVIIDTVRLDGQLAAVVSTADGWSTQLRFGFRSTGGVFTWNAGLIETNFLGTANPVGVNFRSEADRNALTLLGGVNRVFGSQIQTGGFFDDLSDGQRGGWQVGLPFRAFSDRRGFGIIGEAASQRMLQFRVTDVTQVDTVQYHRRAFSNRIFFAAAPVAENDRYVRVGVAALVKREEYRLREDTILAIPDTVSGAVSAFLEYRRANFKVVTHYNGFAHQEDLDLSTRVELAAWVAPTTFGYERGGIGPQVTVATGIGFPNGFLRLSAWGNGLFTSAGLDSGRVNVSFTLGTQLVRRQATFLRVQAGAQEGPAPGAEFDLGHGTGPRSFKPHAFTGTRSVWGTFEHRVYLFDDLFGLLGLGIATFLDYGGAWYPDQSARAGGNVGIGIRTGAARATGVNIGRIDLGYRFGDGWSGNRWVMSFGRGVPF
jgi:hypothetical protein